MLEIGPVGTRLRNIARIAVLRGGGLGDLLLAEPAIRSLADSYPDAEIVLLGTPAHQELLIGRPSPVQEVRLPLVAQGVYEPGGTREDALELKRFFRNQAFDRYRRRPSTYLGSERQPVRAPAAPTAPTETA